jgi:hypothetical protein
MTCCTAADARPVGNGVCYAAPPLKLTIAVWTPRGAGQVCIVGQLRLGRGSRQQPQRTCNRRQGPGAAAAAAAAAGAAQLGRGWQLTCPSLLTHPGAPSTLKVAEALPNMTLQPGGKQAYYSSTVTALSTCNWRLAVRSSWTRAKGLPPRISDCANGVGGAPGDLPMVSTKMTAKQHSIGRGFESCIWSVERC